MTFSFPHFPVDVHWPPATASAWFLERGWVAPNVGTLLGAGAAISLVLPAAAAVAALVVSIRAAEPLLPPPPVAALFGLLPLAILIAVAPQPGYGARLWRSAVYGAYSGRDPGREELRRVVLEAKTAPEKRQALGVWRLYGPRP
jgi:hypothetical protein